MMCHKMGLPPTSIIGFGLEELSSEIRVPKPPARMTAFIDTLWNLIELDNVKVCSKCGESKLLVEFQKFSNRKAGVRPECKDCNSKQKKLYRESKKSLVVSKELVSL